MNPAREICSEGEKDETSQRQMQEAAASSLLSLLNNTPGIVRRRFSPFASLPRDLARQCARTCFANTPARASLGYRAHRGSITHAPHGSINQRILACDYPNRIYAWWLNCAHFAMAMRLTAESRAVLPPLEILNDPQSRVASRGVISRRSASASSPGVTKRPDTRNQETRADGSQSSTQAGLDTPRPLPFMPRHFKPIVGIRWYRLIRGLKMKEETHDFRSPTPMLAISSHVPHAWPSQFLPKMVKHPCVEMPHVVSSFRSVCSDNTAAPAANVNEGRASLGLWSAHGPSPSVPASRDRNVRGRALQIPSCGDGSEAPRSARPRPRCARMSGASRVASRRVRVRVRLKTH